MSTTTNTIGNQIDAVLHDSSQNRNLSRSKPETLEHLLASFGNVKQLPMLRTTARHIADCLGVQLEQVDVHALVGLSTRLTIYLEGRHHKRNAIRSYRNYAGVLLRKAKELGWIDESTDIADAWERIVPALGKLKGARGIVRYAIDMRKSPSTFSDDDLRGWAQLMVERRHDYKYVQRVQHRFRKQLLQAGLAVKVPGIFRNWKPPIKYAVPLSELPQPLQREILALLKWKQADYAPSRRASSRLRPVSASRLQSAFTHLYGFLVNIMPGLPDCDSQINPDSIRTMIELVTRESVTAYIDWYINVRQLKGRPLASKLGQMSAALKEHPSYRDKGFEWLDDLIHGIPHESESAQRERKERKYLPYEILQNVPHRIHQTRQDAAKESAKALAIVVRNELLMQWIVVLPWRQRNIRECRVGLKSEGANLFKSEIEQWDSIKKPKWVQQALQRNPHEQFWQYHFRESETKNGREVRSIVPRRLVALLEEYLKQHRGNLIQGSDPGTLLLNDDGRPLTDSRVTTLVSKLTLRHAGRRVTPHIFRDIWAYWWLASHPEDYLTVSKRLWHRNLQTTLRIYGCKFDEAQADCRVEDWLESHE